MTSRERLVRCMHYQSVDHVPDHEFGYWKEVYPLWQAQGMPKWVKGWEEANRFFRFETYDSVPMHLIAGMKPHFRPGVVSKTDTREIVRDKSGVLYERRKDGHSTIPHYLEFPIKTRADWKKFKKRLDPASPKRVLPEEEWEEYEKKLNSSPLPVSISLGSLFGVIRNWMGFEGAALACAEDPLWVHEMVEHLCDFSCALIERPLQKIKVDSGSFWEDIAFNHGPMISPKMFKEFLSPRYKRITNLCRKYGLDVFTVDCDGNINDIAGLWLESGVNCMFPIEVGGGTDPIELRRRFGKDMLLKGGVNKRALIAGKEAIEKELARLAPLVEEGGFIPHVDHLVPPDVTYENYLYYVKRKREVFGIPEPEPASNARR